MACHNRRENTLSCLRALKRQSISERLLIEVYLLDDGSTDGTSEAVRNEFSNVHVIEGDGNLYWNRGMHTSFAAAIKEGFDYYVWLNDDSILYENAFEVLLHSSAQLKNSGIECAIIGSAMQDPVSGKFTYGGVKRYRVRWGRIKLERIAPANEMIQCEASNGNCVLIPAIVAKTIGNLDPVYLHRWGDHDYCFRALKHGCSVWLAPGYLGTCEKNPTDGTWEDVSLPILDRIRKLNSPRGYQFRDYVVYTWRHRGSWWLIYLIWPYLKIVWQSVRR